MIASLRTLVKLITRANTDRSLEFILGEPFVEELTKVFEGVPASPTERCFDLKVWPAEFEAMMLGEKWFEYRKNDRGYQVGDVLELREYSPEQSSYSGRSIFRRITYIQHGTGQFGIPQGFCVMSLML